jgi:sec-independent protein translocase protein TatA
MFGLGIQELLIIFGIAIVIFGPSKLPQIGAGLGKAIRDFKKGVSSSEENEDLDKDAKKPASKDLPN